SRFPAAVAVGVTTASVAPAPCPVACCTKAGWPAAYACCAAVSVVAASTRVRPAAVRDHDGMAAAPYAPFRRPIPVVPGLLPTCVQDSATVAARQDGMDDWPTVRPRRRSVPGGPTSCQVVVTDRPGTGRGPSEARPVWTPRGSRARLARPGSSA